MVDANIVARNLAIGSLPPRGRALADSGVDVLVLAAREAQPPNRDYPGVEVIRAPFADRFFEPLGPVTQRKVYATARQIAEHVKSGHNVLVTCLMGRNRSGLLAGLALRELGVSGPEAVRAIQKNRPGALNNPRFRDLVLRNYR